MKLFNNLAPLGRNSHLFTAANDGLDLPFGTARQALLTRALAQVQRAADATPSLRFDLPGPEQLRMRKLVHRATQRPVFKVMSVKLGRIVQCESTLEREAALLLDVSPDVQSYGEQPARIHYVIDNQWHSHIPDFAVLVGGRLTFVEIKFAKDLDQAINDRSRVLEEELARMGLGYCVLTEQRLQWGELLQNATRVLRRARHPITDLQLLATLEKLRTFQPAPLGAFDWSVANSGEAVGIAKLIMNGQAAIDASVLLSDKSMVWLAQAGDQAGGAA